MNSYSIYKGDRFLFSGSKKQCADFLGVSEQTIYYYSTKVHLKRVSVRKTGKPVVVTVRN